MQPLRVVQMLEPLLMQVQRVVQMQVLQKVMPLQSMLLQKVVQKPEPLLMQVLKPVPQKVKLVR